MPTLFERITDPNNFDQALRKALKGKNQYSWEAMEFMENETYNLEKLRRSVVDGAYKFSGYQRFTVYEPKERIIDAPHFQDKVVQLAISKVLKDIYQPCFIFDSYASIDDKGTHKCADRISHFLRKAKWQYGDGAYIIKLDIRKFFYSIDRERLKQIIRRKIRCSKTEWLIHEIVDSADEIDETGLPLGNTLSQLFANVYLNELDQFAKRKLSIKFYVRYMDDVIVIMSNKREAKEVFAQLGTFIKEHLNLDLNINKSKIFPIRQGVNAIGFKTFATHRLLRNRSKQTIKRKTRTMRRAIKSGKMTAMKAEQILNSWHGHSMYANSYNFIEKLLTKHNYIYKTNKGTLKVNELALAS